jgi:hypothetical protein
MCTSNQPSAGPAFWSHDCLPLPKSRKHKPETKHQIEDVTSGNIFGDVVSGSGTSGCTQ